MRRWSYDVTHHAMSVDLFESLLPVFLDGSSVLMADDGISRIPLTSVGLWKTRAKCASIDDPDIFFPPDGGDAAHARQICAECPVQAECLDYAIGADEEYGIWGGLDPRERWNLKRRRARRRAAEDERRSGGAA